MDSNREMPCMRRRAGVICALLAVLAILLVAAPLTAQEAVPALPETQHQAGGEANLVLPDLNSATFLGGIGGRTLLTGGMFVCVLGFIFGLLIYTRLRNMPVHSSMLEVSELIYETCKTYLMTQGRFLLILEALIAAIIIVYFGFLQGFDAFRVSIILLFSVIGICGQLSRRLVRNAGEHVRKLANGLRQPVGQALPLYDIPLRAGMSIGMLLISVELLLMLLILLFIPGDPAGPCFIGFAIGESLGAAALRVAGGIFTKIADIGADLMKIVFKIKEDDARNPGVIADCTGDNAGDSVGPTADGFETYGVTGVALITFILLAVERSRRAGPAAGLDLCDARHDGHRLRRRLLHQRGFIAKARYGNAEKMNFEAPADHAGVADVDRFCRPDLRRQLCDDPDRSATATLWWKLSTVITLRHARRRDYSGIREGLHLDGFAARARESSPASREGGASLNILSGFVAGNFSGLLARSDDPAPHGHRVSRSARWALGA